jgi:hypothetical protein
MTYEGSLALESPQKLQSVAHHNSHDVGKIHSFLGSIHIHLHARRMRLIFTCEQETAVLVCNDARSHMNASVPIHTHEWSAVLGQARIQAQVRLYCYPYTVPIDLSHSCMFCHKSLFPMAAPKHTPHHACVLRDTEPLPKFCIIRRPYPAAMLHGPNRLR